MPLTHPWVQIHCGRGRHRQLSLSKSSGCNKSLRFGGTGAGGSVTSVTLLQGRAEL